MNTDINPTTTRAQVLIREHKIPATLIAKAAGCSQKTVLNALNIDRHKIISPAYLELVRNRTVKLLRVTGWDGNADSLWAEYDQPEQEAA